MSNHNLLRDLVQKTAENFESVTLQKNPEHLSTIERLAVYWMQGVETVGYGVNIKSKFPVMITKQDGRFVTIEILPPEEKLQQKTPYWEEPRWGNSFSTRAPNKDWEDKHARYQELNERFNEYMKQQGWKVPKQEPFQDFKFSDQKSQSKKSTGPRNPKTGATYEDFQSRYQQNVKEACDRAEKRNTPTKEEMIDAISQRIDALKSKL